jgi:hypothetical protein
MAQSLRTSIGNRSRHSNYGLGSLTNNLTGKKFTVNTCGGRNIAAVRYITLNAIRGQCNLDNSNPNGLSGIYEIHTWACFKDLEVRKLIFKDDKRFKK